MDEMEQALAAFQETDERLPAESPRAEKPLTASDLRAAARHIQPTLDPTLEEAIEEEPDLDLSRRAFMQVDCAFCPAASWTVERSRRYYPVTRQDGEDVYESTQALTLTTLSCTCSGESKHGQTTFCVAPALLEGDLPVSYPLAQELGLREVKSLKCSDYLLAVAKASGADLEEVARQMREELLSSKGAEKDDVH